MAPEPLSLVGFFRDTWVLFTHASDPVSLVYVIFLPVAIWVFRGRLGKLGGLGVVGWYCLLAIVVWYFTPRTGGGRFILPYLPAFSILCAGLIERVWKEVYLQRFLIVVVIGASLFSIVYRAGANSKYLPVILGQESKREFLTKYLHFDYGDFVDSDGYFARTIKPTDMVLLYGFHNLYYVDFPFIDASWVGEIRGVREVGGVGYIATQNAILPEKFKSWKLVYENPKTMVKLYRR